MRLPIITLALAITTLVAAQNGVPTAEQLSWANNQETFKRLHLSPDQMTHIRELSERYSKSMNDVLAIKE